MTIIASPDDALLVNFKDGMEIDLDKYYDISDIKNVIYIKEQHRFYIMANKRASKLGYYLIYLDTNEIQETPHISQADLENRFLIN